MKQYVILLCIIFSAQALLPQERNAAIFKKQVNEFWDRMQAQIKDFQPANTPDKKTFKMDYTGIDIPKSKSEFTAHWHNDPVSQGMTGTCWSFSTTSYFESEIFRLTGQKIKLSEMWTAYWEYTEKARGFVRTRGKTFLGEGSEANAVRRVWEKFGAVPLSAYSGRLPGQKVHDHSKLFDEFNAFLQSVKERNAWNEEAVVQTVRAILNNYMGEPPQSFQFENKTYTPKEFLAQVLKLKLEDYTDVMSLMQYPYYTMQEYEVPDNWWHSKEYYNVPLDDFTSTIKKAIRGGYTLCIGGDVSEPGLDASFKAAMIPSFDIPSAYIDENARQMRFTNSTTGDDHGIHLIGVTQKNGKDWYLIKDSGAGSFAAGDKGYVFYHEDYIKLKMLGFLSHKDAVKELLAKKK